MSKKDIITYISLCLFWGVTVTAIKVGITNGFPKFIYAGSRFFIASICIFISILFINKSNEKESELKIVKGEGFKILLLSIFMFIITYILLYTGYTFLPSGIAGIIGSTIPLFTMIFAHFSIKDDKFTLYKVLGLVISVTGLIFLLVSSGRSFASSGGLVDFIKGFILCLCACASFGVANVLTKKFQLKTSHKTSTMYQTFIAGIILIIISVFSKEHLSLSPNWKAYLGLFHSSVLGTGVAYVLYYKMVEKYGPSKCSTIPLVVPFVAIIFGFLLLKENLSIFSLIAGLVIISGVGFILFDKAQKVRA